MDKLVFIEAHDDRTKLSPSAVIDIVTRSVVKVDGFHSFSTRFYDGVAKGITDTLSDTLGLTLTRRPGVTVKYKKGESFFAVSVYLNVKPDIPVRNFGRDVQASIRKDLASLLDLDGIRINVHIESITEDEDGHGG